MEWSEHVLNWVRVLAWPLLVVGVVIAFKRNIRDLLGRLERWTGPGHEATFREAREADEKLEEGVERLLRHEPEPSQGGLSQKDIDALVKVAAKWGAAMERLGMEHLEPVLDWSDPKQPRIKYLGGYGRRRRRNEQSKE